VRCVIDPDEERAHRLAADIGCAWAGDWDSAKANGPYDACIIATPHISLAPLTVRSLRDGCHVLCEKPLGRDPNEARASVAAARETGRTLMTGFTLRHHWAIREAHRLVTTGGIGRLMHVRCRYGHGGRPGYESEWRGDPELAGGGELIDQGIHVLDLFCWFLGEPAAVHGLTATSFWPIQPLEDNVFALMQTESGAIGSMHASWTQWRNLFSLEVFGSDGYALVDGLGGSYGRERLTLGRRQPAGGVPIEEEIEGPPNWDPWVAEWDEFLAAVREGRSPRASGEDGLRALEIAHRIYRAAGRLPAAVPPA
jgi:predicted dehydrogenase